MATPAATPASSVDRAPRRSMGKLHGKDREAHEHSIQNERNRERERERSQGMHARLPEDEPSGNPARGYRKRE